LFKAARVNCRALPGDHAEGINTLCKKNL